MKIDLTNAKDNHIRVIYDEELHLPQQEADKARKELKEHFGNDFLITFETEYVRRYSEYQEVKTDKANNLVFFCLLCISCLVTSIATILWTSNAI